MNSHAQVHSVSDNIRYVEVPLVAQTPVRVTLVWGTDCWVLIDTGIKQMGGLILDVISGQGRRNPGVVVNTHAHHDHIGSNHQVKTATGALLAAPAGAVRWIEDFETHYREFCLVEPDILPDSRWMREECLDILDHETHVDLTLGEGNRLRPGGADLEVLQLPGHMKDEIGFIERLSNTLILGDVVVNNGVMDIGPLFHGYQDAGAYKRTLARLRTILREKRVRCVVSAHLPVTDADGFLDILDSADHFLARIEADLIEIVGAIQEANLASVWSALCDKWSYRKEFRGLAMVKTHLEHLMERGVLSRSEAGSFQIA